MDQVLQTLVPKTRIIQQAFGSLSAVLDDLLRCGIWLRVPVATWGSLCEASFEMSKARRVSIRLVTEVIALAAATLALLSVVLSGSSDSGPVPIGVSQSVTINGDAGVVVQTIGSATVKIETTARDDR